MDGGRIILAKDTGFVRLDVGSEALCVHHKSYTPPLTSPGCRHIVFDEFKKNPRGAMMGRSTLVLVGMNRIITPSNRTEEVFEVIHNNSTDWLKISMDRTLFISKPWRAWFHFGSVDASYREYTYSYLAESHWNAFQKGRISADPFSFDIISEFGDGVIETTYRRYFDDITVDVVQTTEEDKAIYAELKTACFEEENTAPAIIRRLAAFARDICPQRSIPVAARFFNRMAHHIIRTDLGVDEYLVGELLSMARLTDAIGDRFFTEVPDGR